MNSTLSVGQHELKKKNTKLDLTQHSQPIATYFSNPSLTNRYSVTKPKFAQRQSVDHETNFYFRISSYFPCILKPEEIQPLKKICQKGSPFFILYLHKDPTSQTPFG